jgi:hypothetical protein
MRSEEQNNLHHPLSPSLAAIPLVRAQLTAAAAGREHPSAAKWHLRAMYGLVMTRLSEIGVAYFSALHALVANPILRANHVSKQASGCLLA